MTEPFPCDECDALLVNFYSLLEHKTQKHNKQNGNPIKCGECEMIFGKATDLEEHKKSHHASNQYV